jgi:putative endonuclease
MRRDACAVYILSNVNRSVLYTGVTGDLVKRVFDHRARANPACFTARYRVDQLVHFEAYDDMRLAIEREKQIKSWTRAKKISLIERGNRGWKDLWPEIAG